MASKGFTFLEPFNNNDNGWTLSSANISGGLLNITGGGGYGRLYSKSNWYFGVDNDFIIEYKWNADVDIASMTRFLVRLLGETTSIEFRVYGTTTDLYVIRYSAVNQASGVFNPLANTWYTARIRRVGTVYYFRADSSLNEISWDYGTARALSYVYASYPSCAGEYDNFKYSWIKAVLEGDLSFIGTLTSRKVIQVLLEGALSFIGTLNRKVSLKRIQEGTISFIGTLQRKISYKRLLEGSISFIGTLLGSRLFKKTLEGDISFIGTLSKTRTYRRTLEGIISFVGKLKVTKLWRAVSKMSNIWTPEDKRSNVWTPQDKRDNDWTEE